MEREWQRHEREVRAMGAEDGCDCWTCLMYRVFEIRGTEEPKNGILDSHYFSPWSDD